MNFCVVFGRFKLLRLFYPFAIGSFYLLRSMWCNQNKYQKIPSRNNIMLVFRQIISSNKRNDHRMRFELVFFLFSFHSLHVHRLDVYAFWYVFCLTVLMNALPTSTSINLRAQSHSNINININIYYLFFFSFFGFWWLREMSQIILNWKWNQNFDSRTNFT